MLLSPYTLLHHCNCLVLSKLSIPDLQRAEGKIFGVGWAIVKKQTEYAKAREETIFGFYKQSRRKRRLDNKIIMAYNNSATCFGAAL